jgi:hypothetical protein
MQPTINVNLDTCARFEHCEDGYHDPVCPKSKPVLIPCPIPRTVEFQVTLGECTVCPPNREGVGHFASCAAYPVKVVCSIYGKTWAESEVNDMECHRGTHDAHVCATEGLDVLQVARARWALVKALVLGHTDLSALLTGPKALELLAQRNAVFAALAGMARAEEAAYTAQAHLAEHLGATVERFHARTSEMRPSAAWSCLYVESLIEQVGILGVAQ